MSKFIKLTNMLINTNDINKILIEPNKYFIYTISKKNDGFVWAFAGFGFGALSSHTDLIEVCKTNHAIDYEILTEWMNEK